MQQYIFIKRIIKYYKYQGTAVVESTSDDYKFVTIEDKQYIIEFLDNLNLVSYLPTRR